VAKEAIRDSVMQIVGGEVTISNRLENKMTGLSVGKIVLSSNNTTNLQSLTGGSDLLKMLELTPGVRNSGDANTNMYIRGGDAGHNLLQYNDIPLYTPGHLLNFFPFFNSDHIATIELNKGGINACYGGRLSSVINASSHKNLPPAFSVKGNIGLLSSQVNLSIPISEKWGVYISGRKTYIDLLTKPILDLTVNHNANNAIEELGYDFYDVNMTAIGKISDKDKLIFDFYKGKDKFNMQDDDFVLKGKLEWQTTLFSTKWEHQTNKGLLTQQIYLSSYKNDLNSDQSNLNMDMNSEIRDIGYKNSYSFSIGEIRTKAGIQYAYHDIQPQIYQLSNINSLEDDKNPRSKAQEAALYLTSTIRITDVLNMDLGLRYNAFYNNQFYNHIDPRVALFYRVDDDILLRGSYTRQSQYLNLLTLGSIGLPVDFWIASSKKISPQTGDEFSLGYFQSLAGHNFEVSAELYYRKMNQLNEYQMMLTDWQFQSYEDNVFTGKGNSYGLELIVKKNRGKLTGWISYALGKSDRKFPELNEGKTFPARFDRRHDLSLVGSYSFNDQWKASLVYVYATGNAYTLPSSWYIINSVPVKEYGDYNGARMPDYNRTDLSVSYWYKEENGFIFSVYNLFMVNNPIYIFMNVEENDETGALRVKIKQKKFYTIMPSISWRFKF
ncbi:TonB-dependent receptor, partial [Bacteroidales bacterium OttesenSCG-928-A17]|nr:TonB-dependent receptor [Bacteroidales bacterium OttesenSCG-928-A17]